jgi:formate dehydrogenase subunit gamma
MSKFLQRNPDRTRMNHWAVVLLFVCAALSGLAFFHPSLYFFSLLFGGGPWARILHPFIGVLMAFGFVFLFAAVWRDNIWRKSDREWMANVGEMIGGDKSKMPPVDKYNGGQKLVFWIFGVSLLILFVTGLIFWRPYFVDFFPVGLRRVAVVLHAFSAVLLILSVVVHVYAAIWVKGTMRAMTRGTVSEAWARQNHSLWFKRMTGN